MKGVLLLSDGIDSPVAGYIMGRQGMELVCLSFTYGKSHGKLKRLSAKIGTLVARDFSRFQSNVMKKANRRYQCILCKRQMYREAEALAEEIGAQFIVTGESLGQVASQTLENMALLDEAVKIPVLRPLLCYDKQETIAVAKQIGTYGISVAESSRCPYVPRSPATRASLHKIRQEEWNTLESM